MVLSTRTLHVRCYAELNAFLPRHRRHKAWPYRVSDGVCIEDIITAIGLPRSQVALVLVNGRRVGFEEVPEDGARVTLYPEFSSLTHPSPTPDTRQP